MKEGRRGRNDAGWSLKNKLKLMANNSPQRLSGYYCLATGPDESANRHLCEGNGFQERGAMIVAALTRWSISCAAYKDMA